MTDHLLEIKNLKIGFWIKNKINIAVDNISFHVDKGETLCIVGESGCGKSVTALSIMKLLASPPAKYLQGQILYNGKDLLKCKETEIRNIRGNKISMIFQEPMTSLNPVLTIGKQLCEAITSHNDLDTQSARFKAEELLKMVGIADGKERLKQYPHQMSGGMKQRVMIAMAIACKPDILIADEPTTALDVTIQAQILYLLAKMKKELGMSLILITHDLGVVAGIADRVVVMYGGTVVEQASAGELYKNPMHPYTKGLLSCIPRMDSDKNKLYTIPGKVPSLEDMPKGCKFANRCNFAKPYCFETLPNLKGSEKHTWACHIL